MPSSSVLRSCAVGALSRIGGSGVNNETSSPQKPRTKITMTEEELETSVCECGICLSPLRTDVMLWQKGV
ncbi:hypothetical protein Y1Q_0013638 [Alligator mississippiensis]|uniref:Uncharacterized protein n=1 Tax=Alligator mississippiensis TaxID=8496 RepID=A0A151P3X6_ALLMI|nr:hypothetical protein Y1Q_0013638 [Alligator mississippiensis]